MGYQILYDWQFIRSEEGITPVVLMGSSNVTQPHYSEKLERNVKRRERSWGCMFSHIGVTENEFMDFIRNCTGQQYQEHWMCKGKWVDDAGIIRWAKNAVNGAARVEDILLLNRPQFLTIECRLAILTWSSDACDFGLKYLLEKRVSTTSELDDWIRQMRPVMAQYKSQSMDAFPIIQFSKEKLVKAKALPDTIVLKQKNGVYVSDITIHDGEVDSVSYTNDPKKSRVFSKEEYLGILGNCKCSILSRTRPVSGLLQQYPYNAIVMVTVKRNGEKLYVSEKKRGSFRVSSDVRHAVKFKDLAAAKAAAKQYEKKLYQGFYEVSAYTVEQ